MMGNNTIDLYDFRGAIYVPARAFNAYQAWRDYNAAEAERDMKYAASLNLQALRIWLSYEYWREKPGSFESSFESFLSIAQGCGIKIFPSLFEANGRDSTPENITDTDLGTAVCVASPSIEVLADRTLWEGPLSFVEYFMYRYASDDRLIAIELMNEPEQYGAAKNVDEGRRRELRRASIEFARTIMKEAGRMKGSVPLSMGSPTLEANLHYMDLGLDILQLHPNFPVDIQSLENELNSAVEVQELLDKPVWVTEWQRVRLTDDGIEGPTDTEELKPGYATMANTIRKYRIGDFFWSLMLKPAYLACERKAGTLNGIFHEDGAVYSLADARAISGNPDFKAEERPEWPEWVKGKLLQGG